MAEEPDLWWRCDANTYYIADEWADIFDSNDRLTWTSFAVVRSTPKGVWLRGFLTEEFFVLGTATRQRAVPTKALALRDAICRKERHVQGCKARLARAEGQLQMLLREQGTKKL